MATTKRTTVVGVFTDRRHAQQAVEELRRVGFREDQIGVIAREDTAAGASATPPEEGSKWAEGAATGAVAGAGVGGLWALGIAAGLLPAIGPVIAGGILASVISSAVGGAVAGGIVGALIGLGIPEEEARYYESEFHSGRTLVTVRANGRYDEAFNILRRHGAYDMHSRPAATVTTAATAAPVGSYTSPTAHPVGSTVAAGGEQKIQLHEEQLRAHKQPVQTGEVQVRKEVVTEHKTLDVPVQREEVIIERHPVAGQPAAATDLRAGQEVRIPVREEQVRVEKQPVVKEEVTVNKRTVQDTERVGGTVRKEELNVERKGDVQVKDKGSTGRQRKNP